ncbi:MAG: hypothetical protein ACREI7_09335 [Myxococcota bacterium]
MIQGAAAPRARCAGSRRAGTSAAAADAPRRLRSAAARHPTYSVDTSRAEPDLSLHVLREPRGEWIGITARSGIEADGIGQSSATLFDDEGPIARALVSLLVERRP